jgi:predicted Rossmann fold nucleotide-binding protein DprA/Smf involved in DNA uptake
LTLRIVSGGQTGVDRAALDAAQTSGVPCGGWCPAGRRAEDGVIDTRYPLEETPDADYAVRTRWNVRDSAATLIISPSPLTGGTALTQRVAEEQGRPHLVVDPHDDEAVERIRRWIAERDDGVINVAGPRESTCPGIYERALAIMTDCLAAIREIR